MRMGEAAKNQFFSWLHFARPSLLSVAVLIPCLSFIWFLSSGFSPFLVSLPILILSTIFLLKFTKKKMILVENVAGPPLCNKKIPQEVEAGVEEIHQVDEERVGEEIHQVVGRKEEAARKLQPILENETDQDSEMGVIHDYQEDFPSDSDDSVASEIFELKWTCPSNVDQNLANFDSSLSEEEEEDDDDDDDDDDDSLIEISLPSSESSGLEEDPDQNVETKLPDILPESIFRQHGLKELLAEINEMNEEDNLIEIDISMGSIKCSRFEIEA